MPRLPSKMKVKGNYAQAQWAQPVANTGNVPPMPTLSNYMTFYNWNANAGTDYSYNIDLGNAAAGAPKHVQHTKIIPYFHSH